MSSRPLKTLSDQIHETMAVWDLVIVQGDMLELVLNGACIYNIVPRELEEVYEQAKAADSSTGSR